MAKKQTFSQLKDLWYKKLKDSGFDDIESDEDHLKRYMQTMFNQKRVVEQHGGWQIKAAYYQMAENFLHNHAFESEIDRAIWEYHTNAIAIRDIVITLNDTKLLKTSRQTVWRTINRLEHLMKLRYLTGYKADD